MRGVITDSMSGVIMDSMRGVIKASSRLITLIPSSQHSRHHAAIRRG